MRRGLSIVQFLGGAGVMADQTDESGGVGFTVQLVRSASTVDLLGLNRRSVGEGGAMAESGATLGFMTPGGELTLNPPLGLLREWILGRAMTSFPDRRGCAALQYYAHTDAGYWQEVDQEPSLLILAVEPHGLFVGYREADGDIQWAPYDGTGAEDVVEYYPADGCPVERLAVACFVSPDLAWQIVQDFYQTRQRSRAVEWVGLHELGLDWG